MTKTLDVYLRSEKVGRLIQDANGQLVFDYAATWLANPLAIPLSHSLPLREKRFSRKECRGFFSGILPEANQRERVAHNLGVSASNDFSLLEQIGGECAGAVTFIPAGALLINTQQSQYRELSPDELAQMLAALPRRPLMAGEEGVRLSLAGAQDKVALYLVDGRIAIPLNGSPSTHILKPAIERFEGLVFNEAFCMQLAAAIGLPTAPVKIGQAAHIDYLQVERYDRIRVAASVQADQLVRLHQEDFCQALGIVSENKYQAEGGPSLAQCFALLRERSSKPVIDLQRLLDAVIFNFIIGNNDAHGKNFSLIYHQASNKDAGGSRNESRLAPLYDVLSTAYYPELGKKMAMKLGGEYVAQKVRLKHFEQLALDAGLSSPMVKRRLLELVDAVLANIDQVPQPHAVSIAVAHYIRQRCQWLQKDYS
jgi:serine/threonine-protein kinase HipA